MSFKVTEENEKSNSAVIKDIVDTDMFDDRTIDNDMSNDYLFDNDIIKKADTVKDYGKHNESGEHHASDKRVVDLMNIKKKENILKKRFLQRIEKIDNNILSTKNKSDIQRLIEEKLLIEQHLTKLEKYKKEGVNKIIENNRFIDDDMSAFNEYNLPDIVTKNLVSENQEFKPRQDIGKNNWTLRNEKTVFDIMQRLIKTLFIYEFVLEKKSKLLDRYTILALIITGLSTLLGSIDASVGGSSDNNKNKSFMFGFSVITALLSFFSFVILGILRLKRYEDNVKDFTTYIKDIDQLFYDLKITMLLPCSLRKDAVDVITKTEDIYREITKNSPKMARSEENNAIKAYHEFSKSDDTHIKLHQKFYRSDFSIIDIV